MANLKVVVPLLNKRKYPVIDTADKSNVVGSVKQDFQFESIAEVTNALGNWYQDRDGYYYWGGGVKLLMLPQRESIANDRFNEKDFWWIKNFNIGKLWNKGLSGKGIKIAVLDSGLALPHPDLIIDNNQLKDFSQSNSGITDHIGHGTHVTGIVKASNNGFGIKGLAFNSDFYFGKITNDLYGDKVEYLIRAVEWAIELKVDIISISAGFLIENDDLESVIGDAETNNILVVCAAGNKDETTGIDILYPAHYESTLSIGGLTKNGAPLSDTINSGQTDLFAPGEKIMSTYLESKYLSLSGSSQSTPYTAGVACLILESKRKSNPNYEAKNIKRDLLTNADLVHFGKKINPLNTLI